MNPIKVIDERISRKLAGIRQAFRGVITLVKAAGEIQLVQLDGLSGEKLQDAEQFQQYGCTSNPPKGSMAIVLPIGGKTAHGIIIATEHGTYRLKDLAEGEVALYDDQGQKIHITRNGIVVDGGGKTVTVQNVSDLNVTTTGAVNVTAGGKATVKADLVEIDGGGALHGCVGGGDLCAFTGAPHPQFSATVKVSK
jgi:phage baseplate assembly protein V